MANKMKVSITLNDTLMRFIDLVRGDVPRSRFIENYLKDKVSLFEAIWISSDELKALTNKERLYAGVAGTVGRPLHKHEGFIDVGRDSLDFYDKELQRTFSLHKSEIRSTRVGYDKDFRRGINPPPMRLTLKKGKMYLFTRRLGSVSFRGENPVLLQALV